MPEASFILSSFFIILPRRARRGSLNRPVNDSPLRPGSWSKGKVATMSIQNQPSFEFFPPLLPGNLKYSWRISVLSMIRRGRPRSILSNPVIRARKMSIQKAPSIAKSAICKGDAASVKSAKRASTSRLTSCACDISAFGRTTAMGTQMQLYTYSRRRVVEG